MIKYFIFAFIAAGISFAITPLIRLLAKKTGIYDFPSERKIHSHPVPLLGGIPIFVAFNLTLVIGLFLKNSYIEEFLSSNWKALLICQVLILFLGIYDDIKRLQPGIKFLFQVFVGILLVLSGFGIQDLANPFTGQVVHLGFLSVFVTILWVVGITNALNLIDGLDGLAAGTSLIASITIFMIAFFNQNIGIAIIALTLAGAILGFLRYNFHPAKIFLGDSGSLLLGFLLAVFSIKSSSKGAVIVTVMAPMLALGLPIMDTLLSMLRRFLKSINMLDMDAENGNVKAMFSNGFSMFKADKDHVHHRLLKMGFSHRKVVTILYGLCVALCVLASLSVAFKNFSVFIFLGAIIVAFVVGIRALKYQEFKILENGLLLPIFSSSVVNKRLFQAFFDLFSISLAFYLSIILVNRGFGGAEKLLFIQAISVVLFIKISIFSIWGLYKGAWAYSSVEDILTILKAVFVSSIGSSIILLIIFGIKPFGGFIFFVIEFYLLFTFVAGSRVSYRVFQSFYKRNINRSTKNVLIYGAGHKGSTVLKEIRYNGNYICSPIGFIDDNPLKKGTNLHNCPILGSFEDIEQLVDKNKISEIIIATGKIGKEKVNKLTDICKQKDITVRQYEFRFYEFP